MKALNSILQAESKRAEDESWKIQESVTYRVNVICNGMGFPRSFNALDDFGHGISEQEVHAIAKRFRAKGFEVQVHKSTTTTERIA